MELLWSPLDWKDHSGYIYLPTYPVETPIAQGVTSFVRKTLCNSNQSHKRRENCNNMNAYFHHLYFFLITAKLTLCIWKLWKPID